MRRIKRNGNESFNESKLEVTVYFCCIWIIIVLIIRALLNDNREHFSFCQTAAVGMTPEVSDVTFQLLSENTKLRLASDF